MNTKATIALIALIAAITVLWVTVPPVGFALLVIAFFATGTIAWKRGII